LTGFQKAIEQVTAPGGLVEMTTTVPSLECAEKLAHRLVTSRLVACAQIVGPVRSIYRWDGAIEQSNEWRLLMKTTPMRCGSVIETIREEHPYDVPEISMHAIAWMEPEYLRWAVEQTEG
jgi:periplasmic divalent cation tolerance protein